MNTRRTGAIAAGFLTLAILSLATDQVLHHPLLALSCRLFYGVIGGYVTARLAPYAPMHHTVILGLASFVFSAITVPWYPIVLLLTLPAAAAGGVLYCAQRRDRVALWAEPSVIPFLVPYTFRLPDCDGS
jgi:hypothetical protein